MSTSFLSVPNFPQNAARGLRAAGLAGMAILVLIVFWAAWAPLATSLTVSGKMVSTQPVVPLQTPIGGRLAAAELRLAQTVQAGDVLIRFDMRDTRNELESVDALIAMLTADLGLDPQNAGAGVEAAEQAARLRHESHAAELRQLAAESAAVSAEAARLAVEIGPAERKAVLARAEHDRKSRLLSRGAIPESDLTTAELAHIDAEAEVRRLQSALDASVERLQVLEAQQATLQATFAADDAARDRQARAQLAELVLRQQRLLRQIDASVLRAPVSGTIVNTRAVSAGQVFSPGEVLAEIAAPLDSIEIELMIPVRYIDQISLGQAGTLVVSALPQRHMPRIRVTVTAIADAMQNDAAGTPLGYAARVAVDPGDLDAARRALGSSFRLQRDMPVQVLLQGRSTTVLSYLTRPIADMMRHGTEEG